MVSDYFLLEKNWSHMYAYYSRVRESVTVNDVFKMISFVDYFFRNLFLSFQIIVFVRMC